MLVNDWRKPLTVDQRAAVRRPAAERTAGQEIEFQPSSHSIIEFGAVVDATTEICLLRSVGRLLAELESRGVVLEIGKKGFRVLGGELTEEERKRIRLCSSIIVKVLTREMRQDEIRRREEAARCERERREAWRTVIEGNQFTGLDGEGI